MDAKLISEENLHTTIALDLKHRKEWLTSRKSTINSLHDILESLKKNFTISNYTRLTAASAGLTGVSLVVGSSVLAYFTAGISLGLFIPGMVVTGVGACISVAATVRENLIDRQLIDRARQLVQADIDQTSQFQDFVSLVVSSIELSREIIDTTGIHSNAALTSLLARIKGHATARLVGQMFVAIGAVIDLLELIEAGQNIHNGSPIVEKLNAIIEKLCEEMEFVEKSITNSL